MRDERLGPLRIGMAAEAVRSALGPPASSDGPAPDQVQGGFTWTWRYPERGVELSLWAETRSEPPSVGAIKLREGSSLRTRFGIGVGSSGAEVERAYRACWAPESTEEQRVAGSVYGGVVFTMKGNQVAELFVGASAE
jgi:hypothetical protein